MNNRSSNNSTLAREMPQNNANIVFNGINNAGLNSSSSKNLLLQHKIEGICSNLVSSGASTMAL